MNDVSAFSTEVAAEHRYNCSVQSTDLHLDIKKKKSVLVISVVWLIGKGRTDLFPWQQQPVQTFYP